MLTAGEVARSEARVQQLAAAVSPSAIPAPVPAVPLHNRTAVSAALETADRAIAPPPPPEGQVLHAPSDACAASALLDLSGGAAAGIGVPWQGVLDMAPPAVGGGTFGGIGGGGGATSATVHLPPPVAEEDGLSGTSGSRRGSEGSPPKYEK